MRPQNNRYWTLGAIFGLWLPGSADAFQPIPFQKSPPQRIRGLTVAAAAAAAEAEETIHDVVVIGSGIGGLSCASILSTHGLNVCVCESHVHPGGAAHAFEIQGYKFDSGPSLFSGLSQDRSPNPLKHVFDFIDEKIDWETYNTWGVVLPEGSFAATIGPEPFQEILTRFGGPKAKEEWAKLMEYMAPLSVAAMALPPATLRNDIGGVLTVGRYASAVLKTIPVGPKLQAPFTNVLEEVGITDPFIKNWLSLLCFLLQGMPPEGTMTAVMAYMLADWYRPGVVLDYPKGGVGAVVDALVRGVTKHGGKVHLGAHVDQILVEEGRAVGVKLRNGNVLKAKRGVVSNASIWDTKKLLPSDLLPVYQEDMQKVEQCESFLHLHLGIDATGLPPMQCHYAVVDDWSKGITAPSNVIIISIPSLLDPSLAPPGTHVIHAYTAGNEPYKLWEGLDRKSPEYKKLKEERSQILWKAMEKVMPDVRKRVKVGLEGTPLTHERFLRRDRGTYGPSINAGRDNYPPAKTPIPGLLLCGDSEFPGIGIPATAASGNIAANNLISVFAHLKQLKTIRM